MSAVRLALSPSPRLAGLILVVPAAAALSIWAVLPGAAGALAAPGLLALGLAAAWSRALLRSASSVRALELGDPGLVLDLAGGARLETAVSPRRYVTAALVALPVQGRTILVTRDMLGEPAFRLLRIWALWGRLPAAVAGKQLDA